MDSLNVIFVSKDGLGCFGAKWRQHDCGILLLYRSSINKKLILRSKHVSASCFAPLAKIVSNKPLPQTNSNVLFLNF